MRRGMYDWERFRREKLEGMRDGCRTILDFGRSARSDAELFERNTYVTCDFDPTTEPDIVADICHLHMVESGSYDGVICISILEHVYDPFQAVREIHRVLKPGGSLFGYVPFLYGYHAQPDHYEDYYRFTEEGVRYLLRDFASVETSPVRGNVMTLLNLLPGRLAKIQHCFHWADRFFSGRQVSGFNFFAVK